MRRGDTLQSDYSSLPRPWTDGDNADAFVIFPDDVSFHEALQRIGPAFGTYEPLAMRLLEGFENGDDPTLNSCTVMGFLIICIFMSDRDWKARWEWGTC